MIVDLHCINCSRIERNMPIYEYRCISCGYEFEEVQKFSDPSFEECPDCGEKSAEKQVSMSSFHLKGGGWYKDGYSTKKNESEKPEKPEKSEKEKDNSKSNESSISESTISKEKQIKTENKEPKSKKNSNKTSKEKAA